MPGPAFAQATTDRVSGVAPGGRPATRRLSASAFRIRAVALRLALLLARVLPHPKRTPFTFYYLLVLLATTITANLLSTHERLALLHAASTNAANLLQRPLGVLVSSALWLADGHWQVYLLLFTVLIAPLERRIGPRWTLAVFASGHVLATLLTELPVLYAIREHLAPARFGHWLDFGVSYGMFAVAGALVLALRWRQRRWAILALYVLVALASLGSGPVAWMTAAGHVAAVHIGMLGWLPWARRRGLLGTLELHPIGVLLRELRIAGTRLPTPVERLPSTMGQ
ncbi:MAG: rhomboid-like protein [Sciscionella sp.]